MVATFDISNVDDPSSRMHMIERDISNVDDPSSQMHMIEISKDYAH